MPTSPEAWILADRSQMQAAHSIVAGLTAAGVRIHVLSPHGKSHQKQILVDGRVLLRGEWDCHSCLLRIVFDMARSLTLLSTCASGCANGTFNGFSGLNHENLAEVNDLDEVDEAFDGLAQLWDKADDLVQVADVDSGERYVTTGCRHGGRPWTEGERAKLMSIVATEGTEFMRFELHFRGRCETFGLMGFCSMLKS